MKIIEISELWKFEGKYTIPQGLYKTQIWGDLESEGKHTHS